MQNSLLIGNGFNRINQDNVNWKKLLDSIVKDKDTMSDLPNIINYEYLLLEKNEGGKAQYGEKKVKEHIAKELVAMKSSHLYDQICELDVQNIMTTNYDYVLDDTLREKYDLVDRHFREKIYSIQRKKQYLQSNKKMLTVWNIHGEIDYPSSIMLGLDHYCLSVAKINQYVNGKYTVERNKVHSIKDKLTNYSFWDCKSWVELFFKSNVYIIGSGLDYSEIDLWWILDKRARMFKNKDLKSKINNKIVFYSSVDKSKHKLCDAFNIEVVDRKDTDWEEFYNFAIQDVKRRIELSH